MTRVVHCKREAYDVLIDRTTKWGNKFRIGPGCTRRQSIKRFRVWLPKQKALLADLHELKGKTLGCWCKPQACHGDFLAKLADAKGAPMEHLSDMTENLTDQERWNRIRCEYTTTQLLAITKFFHISVDDIEMEKSSTKRKLAERIAKRFNIPIPERRRRKRRKNHEEGSSLAKRV